MLNQWLFSIWRLCSIKEGAGRFNDSVDNMYMYCRGNALEDDGHQVHIIPPISHLPPLPTYSGPLLEVARSTMAQLFEVENIRYNIMLWWTGYDPVCSFLTILFLDVFYEKKNLVSIPPLHQTGWSSKCL